MSPTLDVLLWWLAFGGSHSFLSSLPIRQRLIARMGEQLFRGVYSVVSFATFVPLVWAYAAHRHAGPLVWALPMGLGLRWLVYVLMAVAFVLLVAALAHPSPSAVIPGKADPTGAFRITRHPLMMAFALFGLAHLVPNGFATDVVFFGGFAVYAVLGAWHQDQRKIALGTPGYREFCAATPFLPFTGGQVLTGVRELGPVVPAIGLGVTVLVRYFHAALFGG